MSNFVVNCASARVCALTHPFIDEKSLKNCCNPLKLVFDTFFRECKSHVKICQISGDNLLITQERSQNAQNIGSFNTSVSTTNLSPGRVPVDLGGWARALGV